MLQAKSHDGLMVLLSLLTRKELEYVRRNKRFFCPVCNEPVIVKAGTKVIPHFAHHSKTSCPSSRGEGPYHEKGKLILYQWLKSQHLEVVLEPYLSDINQIPDIYLTLKNKKIAIEFQCATTDMESILQRNRGYEKKGITPIWILGANQFKRLGQHYLQVNSFIKQFIHQYSSDYPLTLYFFCPNTFQVATFQHIQFTRNTLAIGTFSFRKLNQIRFHDLFSIAPILNINDLWKKEKKKFRLGRHRRTYDSGWHQWLYLKKMNIEQLPSIVYLPISSQYLMKTPLWDWQSRLVMDILHPLQNGDAFSIKACQHRLRTYLKSPFNFPLIQSEQNPIIEYINLLEHLYFIKRISPQEIKKIRPFECYSHIEKALIGDNTLMDQLKEQLKPNKKQA